MKGFLISLVPSIGALFLLWITLRAIFQADRRERLALARFEAEEDRAAAAAAAAVQVGGAEPAGAVEPADAVEAGETAAESTAGSTAGSTAESDAETVQTPSGELSAAREPKGDGVAP